ncbi:hypothetical protein L1987_24491 [Smallanthus sonchifolius]|uniref:Uncharacterized protein n=1 Tax=Smallanthus sonchifolius TaxID=185202 RepID=A0ACB9IJU5_9ASTR|nr:hypothetical protein L1987_24491 [Smallanthus sonchifolius]
MSMLKSISKNVKFDDIITTSTTPLKEFNRGWAAMFNKLAELGKCGFNLNPYGGIMDEIPADATPYPHRGGNLFKIQYLMNWSEDD